MNEDMKNTGLFFGGIGWFGVVTVGIGCLAMAGCPKYHVWQQGLVGEAELKRAEQNRKIAVQEAEARKEASTLLAAAEIERAKGVAESNRIIGEGLRDNHDYLTYLWIQALGEKSNHVIYVPTEAGLPILEAGRFGHSIAKKKPEEKAKEKVK